MDKLNEGPKAYKVVILSNNYYKLFLCKSIDIIFTFFLTQNFVRLVEGELKPTILLDNTFYLWKYFKDII